MMDNKELDQDCFEEQFRVPREGSKYCEVCDQKDCCSFCAEAVDSRTLNGLIA